jgi:hypothetical protein
MRIVSYYVDKYGVLFQIIRTENSIKINKVIEGIKEEINETQLIIDDLIEKNILIDLLDY